MTVEAVAKAVSSREIALGDWGRVILEEVLFRAAQQVSDNGGTSDSVEVVLSFRLAADKADNCLTITTPGAVEDSIRTRVVMPAGCRL